MFNSLRDQESFNIEEEKPLITEFEDYFEPSLEDGLGIITESVSASIKRKRAPEVFFSRFEALFRSNQIEKIRETAANPNFVQENPEYVSSGELPYLALKFDETFLFKEMKNLGFLFTAEYFIRAIENSELRVIAFIISESLYSESYLGLAFWLMLKRNMIDQAKELLHAEAKLKAFFSGFIIGSRDSIELFLKTYEKLAVVLKQALTHHQDFIAANLLFQNPLLISGECVNIAFDHCCIQTLKIVWSGNIIDPQQTARNRAEKSLVWQKLDGTVITKPDRKKINKMLKISSILEKLLSKNLFFEAEKVLNWPDACNEAGIIRVLCKFNQPNLIQTHLTLTKIDITQSEFLEVFEKGYFKACVKMLESEDPRGLLTKEKIQSSLIELLETGDHCLEAIQILSFINKRDWNSHLTKKLCTTLDEFITTTEELCVCPCPLLYCVLVVEFLHKISSKSLVHKHRCLECAGLFIQQCAIFQESLKDNNVLKHYMLDSDYKGRSALVVIAENRVLKLLKNEDVGALITNLWKGKECLNFWDCSSFYNSVTDFSEFLAPVNTEYPYSFSFSNWIYASSLRYFVNSINGVLLLVVYNCLIIQAIENNAFLDLTVNQSTHGLLRISEILIIGLMVDLVLQYYYTLKTKKVFIFDAIRIIDVIIFGMSLLILANLQQDMGPGKKYPSADPVVFNGAIHSLVNLFVWVRFLLILITTKQLGPFLYMIYCILQKMFSFYFLFACFSIWFAAVFTALFSSSDDLYSSFWISMRTLFAASLGAFDMLSFTDKEVFGCLLLGLYLIITFVILLNLFIALFVTIYEEITEDVKSNYRTMVVSTYQKLKWDEDFGFFVLFTSPFSIFTLFLAPFVLYSENPKVFGLKSSRLLYAGVFGFWQFVLFLLLNIVLLPFVYIIGLFQYPQRTVGVSLGNEGKFLEKNFNMKKLMTWGFCGVFILFFYIIRDSISFWKIVFTQSENIESLHSFITLENFNCLKETINTIQIAEVSVQELVKLWSYTKSLLTFKRVANEEIQSAKDFFINFCPNSKTQMIPTTQIRRLLNNINGNDLEKLENIRLPYSLKAVYNFKNLLGGIEVQGVPLPKKLGNPGGPADRRTLANANKIIREMNEKIENFEKVIQKLKKKLESNKT